MDQRGGAVMGQRLQFPFVAEEGGALRSKSDHR